VDKVNGSHPGTHGTTQLTVADRLCSCASAPTTLSSRFRSGPGIRRVVRHRPDAAAMRWPVRRSIPLTPTRFPKGFIFVVADSRWEQSPDGVGPGPVRVTPARTTARQRRECQQCILDPGEDAIANGREWQWQADPGVASVNAAGTTDQNGICHRDATYPKSYGRLGRGATPARAGVVANDPPTTATFFLWGWRATTPTRTFRRPASSARSVRSTSVLTRN